jgi:hypothetical protein
MLSGTTMMMIAANGSVAAVAADLAAEMLATEGRAGAGVVVADLVAGSPEREDLAGVAVAA